LKKAAKPVPTVYVIAGPNGAGKTTFASEFLPDFVQCREFLNADRPILDGWWLYDASRLPPKLIASEENRHLTVKQKKLYRQIEQAMEEPHEEAG
jgi:predicted ABC-type ATPase